MSFFISNPADASTNADDEAAFSAARSSTSPTFGVLSTLQAGVPKGTLSKAHHISRSFYPGVERDYFVYQPAQVDATPPLSLIVFQDAWLYLQDGFSPTTVFDNLIASGDIPPLVAVFIDPGDLPDAPAQSRGNRSIEYDATNDTYAQFLLGELLPEALSRLNVSNDPADRAVCGMSSGGICSFNLAWHRPDQFGKVISHCGSFTNIRDGHLFPSWVRKRARLPLRVFLQTGAADFDNAWGSWPVANLDMAAALKFRGYDYRLEFGLCGHDLRHGAAIFPQTLRWLWR